MQAQRGCFVGPALVIGQQGGNVWVSYGGRCFLVALEHIRALAPDETFSTKPIVQSGLEELKKAAKATDFIDLTEQKATEA